MKPRLVFIHGRSQQGKDPDALKREWIAAFHEGLALSGREMPISPEDIVFPYYGDALPALQHFDASAPEVPEVVLRSLAESFNDDELAFTDEVLDEICQKNDISPETIAGGPGDPEAQRGIVNHAWIIAVLRSLDRRLPFMSAASIATFTSDVYAYVRRPGIRDAIETPIRAAITAEVPTIVVGHSLGSVVSYNLLRHEGSYSGWNVPLHMTLGCPLGVGAIRKALSPTMFPACASRWVNAFDPRDVVALNPLDSEHFPVAPEVVNLDVTNSTENRHGIAGYLSDKRVADTLYDALVDAGAE